MLMKKMTPVGCVPLPRLYLHESNHCLKFLLWNHLANQSQIIRGTSLGKGNWYTLSRSHDQDKCNTHICEKPEHILQNLKSNDLETCDEISGTHVL